MLLSAQQFTEVTSADFVQVNLSSITFMDADGDGDEDLLLSGNIGTPLPKTNTLYLNDGVGNFNEVMDAPFEQVTDAVLFSDLNGDGSPDVLITGSNDTILTTKLYINDGAANFSDAGDIQVQSIVNGDFAISDVDNDGDQDLVVTGVNNGSNLKLYLNDGMANFTLKPNPDFIPAAASTVEFADINGDGDDDLLVLGLSGNPVGSSTNLYLNDGMGNFTIVGSTPFHGVFSGNIGFSDVDLDDDLDVLITGNAGTVNITKLYFNDGMGLFTESTNNSFTQVGNGSLAFGDIDNDGDEDVLITGNGSGSSRVAEIYINDGMGDFAILSGTSFSGVSVSASKFSDVDGDGDLDVLISGDDGSQTTKLYLNDLIVSSSTSQSFNDPNIICYPNPVSSSQIEIQYNSDHNVDIIITVIDLSGHVLNSQRKTVDSGTNNLTLKVEDFLPGTYILKIENGRKSQLQKIIIQ